MTLLEQIVHARRAQGGGGAHEPQLEEERWLDELQGPSPEAVDRQAGGSAQDQS